MISGIYSLTNIVTDYVYVGGSKDVNKRYWNHISGLIKKTHYNKKLQQDFDLYGISGFKFDILEHFDLDKTNYRYRILLNKVEKQWINKFPLVYNIHLIDK